MEKFEVNILGCGAAIPIGRHMTTSQVVNVHDKLFMVDCGEGTQTQIWKSGIKLTNMDNIFISHAHGDHFFGLVPLLSSLNLMLGRTKYITVFVPEDLKDILMLMLKELCHIPFNVNINTFMGNSNQKISANARKLIIGHYSIRYDDEQQFEQEVKSIFPNAEACNEGMVFRV